MDGMWVDSEELRYDEPVKNIIKTGTLGIGFIGLAMPHVARILFRDADHRTLLPAAALTGTVSLLICDVVSKILLLPVNTITALLGIPIVVWVVVRNKNIV